MQRDAQHVQCNRTMEHEQVPSCNTGAAPTYTYLLLLYKISKRRCSNEFGIELSKKTEQLGVN